MFRHTAIGLAIRVGIAMVAVSLAAIGLACVLSFFRFEETYRSLAVQRLQLTAGEVARVLQSGLDLGLSVESQETVPGILRQQLAEHGDIAEIAVVSCDGRILFNEGEKEGDSLALVGRVSRPSWATVDAGRLAVGQRVSDAMGSCAAGVIVSRDTGALQQAMTSVGERYAVLGGIAGLATTLVMIAAAALFSRRRQIITNIDADIDGLGHEEKGQEAAVTLDYDADRPWESELGAAYAAARPELVRMARQRAGGADLA